MKINRREIQLKLLKYGGFYELIRKVGITVIIDFILAAFINNLSKRFYRLQGTNYGLLEALFFPRGIDRWSRYAHVVNQVEKLKQNKILEAGSGGEGIAAFLNQNCEIFSLDIQERAFRGLKSKEMIHGIVGDGCRLPFRDKAFDVVISVDTAEHIPRPVRYSFYSELKRVCKKKVVLTCPVQSNDGMFQGRIYDIIFQYLYEKNYGVKEPNTAQHIAAGHPTLEELKRAFPDSTIQGYKNCDVWLKYMLFSRKPLLGLFCGLLYYLFWKKDDNKPPYWGAIVISDYTQE